MLRLRNSIMRPILQTLFACLTALPAFALEPIPDKLVVLTFDDSVKSHFTVVREALLKYRFGATFFITEGFDFKTSEMLHMEMWLNNGSQEEFSGLRVQNCIMLKGASEFAQSDDETIVKSDPYIARRALEDNRWIITAWTPCHSTWFNPPCPCIHSDGHFPDCAPGESRRLRGWLSFYEGDAIEAELERIDATGWQNGAEL